MTRMRPRFTAFLTAIAAVALVIGAHAADTLIPRRAAISCPSLQPYAYYQPVVDATHSVVGWYCTSSEPVVYNGSSLTATATEINKLAGVTAGTVSVSKAVVLDSGGGINTWKVLGPQTVTTTITSATPATQRLLYSTLTLTPATTQAVSAGGSLAAVRGEINQTTGKTFTEGFLYGVQGKAIFAGTLNEGSAARVTGLIGQTDTTGATLTAGQVSGVWADLQGNAANSETYPLRVSNSASVSPPALAFLVGHATAAFSVSDLGNGSSGDFVLSASGTSAGQCAQTGGVVFTKTLKIVADGTAYYIGLCTAP